MESPFKNHSSVVMYLEPYLNSFTKNYQNIITLNAMPVGPLSNMVARLTFPKLSIFKELSPFSDNVFNCTYVVCRYPVKGGGTGSSIKYRDTFLGTEDVPNVLAFLRDNGYKVDTDMTRLIQKSDIELSDDSLRGKRRMICIVDYIQ
jgi:hypothetical protein